MTERPNKELALRYYSDTTMAAWHWDETNTRWAPTTPNPCFSDGRHWHVGHEAPTEPPVKMCELAGITFPMPLREAPENGAPIFEASIWAAEQPLAGLTWRGAPYQLHVLRASLYQATREGAIAQGCAMAAALQQAIEGAK